MTSPFARFAPLNDLVRRQGVPLVSRTIIIGGVALLDWDLQQTARFGIETWQPIGRTTEDIDIVIAAADDRGWFEALADNDWQRDPDKRYRWHAPAPTADGPCTVDLLGQYGGSDEAGGTELRLRDYWGGEEGAYICRVLRAYQGQKKFPSMLTEGFFDPVMQGYQWLRLNHLGQVLSKISAVGVVLKEGDSEHQRGLTETSRLRKDLQDLLWLLRDEVVGAITGWQGRIILDELVPALVQEIKQHLATIADAAVGEDRVQIDPEDHALLISVSTRLPNWH